MIRSQPITFRWDGEAMTPATPFMARLADKTFVIGENYRLMEEHERSAASHRHYFAVIHDAWMNLPEEMAERFPTSESLRKFALIKAGYRDERTFVAGSRAEALRLAAFVKPIDDFAIVTATGATVTIWTAKSQSVRAMGGKAFQESKQAVLDVIADLIGVSPETLSREAGQAA